MIRTRVCIAAVILVLPCTFLDAGERTDEVPTYQKMSPGEYAGPRQLLASKNITHKQYVTAKYESNLSAWKCTVAEDESLSVKAFLKGKFIDLNLARAPTPYLKWAQPLDDGVTAYAIGGYMTPGIYVVTTWFEQAGKVLSGERCFVSAVAETAERKPENLTMTLAWIADAGEPKQHAFVINGVVAYKTVAGLEKHLQGLPKDSTLTWDPGCCRRENEPILSSKDEMKKFKDFCKSTGIKFILVPSG